MKVLAGRVQLNFSLRHLLLPGDHPDLELELRRRYRAPHVRFIVRTRALFQAGRCRAASARGGTAAWLMERAPLWVVVYVTNLVR